MASYTVTALGIPPGGYGWDSAIALNQVGHAAGWSIRSTEHAIRWNPAPEFLPTPAPATPSRYAYFSTARGINHSGDVVGYWRDFNTTYGTGGFVFRDGVMHNLNLLLQVEGSLADDINDAGVAVGHARLGAGWHAFIHGPTAGTSVIDFGPLPGSVQWNLLEPEDTIAINNAGLVVGISGFNREEHNSNRYGRAFAFSGGVMKDLGHSVTSITDVNELGQMVGHRAFDRVVQAGIGLEVKERRAFVCQALADPPTLEDLTPVAMYGNSHALGINNHGVVVGYCFTQADRYAGLEYHRACIWRSGQAADLNHEIPLGSGWVLEHANAINDAGQIVGAGVYQGRPRAFRLDPVPINFGPRLPEPWIDPEELPLLVAWILVGVADGAPGVVWLPSGPRPVGPPQFREWAARFPEQREVLLGLAMHAIAARIPNGDSRREMERHALLLAQGALDRLVNSEAP